MVSPLGPSHVDKLRRKLVETAYLRHDVWRSRDEARRHFEMKRRNWDARVIDLYVVSCHPVFALCGPVSNDNMKKHGLRPHPACKWTDAPFNGVTLACTREQEAVSYPRLVQYTR